MRLAILAGGILIGIIAFIIFNNDDDNGSSFAI